MFDTLITIGIVITIIFVSSILINIAVSCFKEDENQNGIFCLILAFLVVILSWASYYIGYRTIQIDAVNGGHAHYDLVSAEWMWNTNCISNLDGKQLDRK